MGRLALRRCRSGLWAAAGIIAKINKRETRIIPPIRVHFTRAMYWPRIPAGSREVFTDVYDLRLVLRSDHGVLGSNPSSVKGQVLRRGHLALLCHYRKLFGRAVIRGRQRRQVYV